MDGINNLFEYLKYGKTIQNDLDEAKNNSNNESKKSLKQELIKAIKELNLQNFKNKNPFELLKMTEYSINLAINGTDEYIKKIRELDTFYKENDWPIKPHNLKKLWNWYEFQDFESLTEIYGLNNKISIERAKKSLVLTGPNHITDKTKLITYSRSPLAKKGFGISATGTGIGIYSATEISLQNPEPLSASGIAIGMISAFIFGSGVITNKDNDSFSNAANLLEERNKFIKENIDKRYL